MEPQKLWTRDFTIITLGTVVSMLGNALSGFAIGLLVLDYSGSVFLYALAMVAYSLPRVVVPVFAGPYLDHFSRRKMIYSLDFLSAALYGAFYFFIRTQTVNYGVFLAVTVLVGSIDSVYSVAYDSLYPNLISPGNYSKAYSISSMIYPLAAVMTPLAAYVYQTVGLAPLFLFNAATFLVAAIFETQIRCEETYAKDAEKSGRYGFAAFRSNLKAGLAYIGGEKGLQVITAYFCVTQLCDSACSTVVLPYFKATASLGVMAYTFVSAAGIIGRLIGGFIHYKYKYPVDKKFAIALVVYICVAAIQGGNLFTPYFVIMALNFLSGVMAVTSYNIRISATQNYVPDTCRARFNGTFQMICTLGGIVGQLAGGALADRIPYRAVMVIFSCVNLAAVYLVMYRGRASVKPIYNRQV